MDPTETERKPRRNLKAFIVSQNDGDLSRAESTSSLSTASLTSILHHDSYESGVSDLEDSYDERFDARGSDKDSDSERIPQRRSEHETTFTKYETEKRKENEDEPRATSSDGDSKAKRQPKRIVSSKFSYENWIAEKRKQAKEERERKKKSQEEAAARKQSEEKVKQDRSERGEKAFRKWVAAKLERESAARRMEAEKAKLKAAMEEQQKNNKAERRSRLEEEFRKRVKHRTQSAAQQHAERERRERERSEQRSAQAQRQFVEWLRRKANERPPRESLAVANGRLVRYYDVAANPPVSFRQPQWRGVLDTNDEADAAYEQYLEQRINDLLVTDL